MSSKIQLTYFFLLVSLSLTFANNNQLITTGNGINDYVKGQTLDSNIEKLATAFTDNEFKVSSEDMLNAANATIDGEPSRVETVDKKINGLQTSASAFIQQGFQHNSDPQNDAKDGSDRTMIALDSSLSAHYQVKRDQGSGIGNIFRRFTTLGATPRTRNDKRRRQNSNRRQWIGSNKRQRRPRKPLNRKYRYSTFELKDDDDDRPDFFFSDGFGGIDEFAKSKNVQGRRSPSAEYEINNSEQISSFNQLGRNKQSRSPGFEIPNFSEEHSSVHASGHSHADIQSNTNAYPDEHLNNHVYSSQYATSYVHSSEQPNRQYYSQEQPKPQYNSQEQPNRQYYSQEQSNSRIRYSNEHSNKGHYRDASLEIPKQERPDRGITYGHQQYSSGPSSFSGESHSKQVYKDHRPQYPESSENSDHKYSGDFSYPRPSDVVENKPVTSQDYIEDHFQIFKYGGNRDPSKPYDGNSDESTHGKFIPTHSSPDVGNPYRFRNFRGGHDKLNNDRPNFNKQFDEEKSSGGSHELTTGHQYGGHHPPQSYENHQPPVYRPKAQDGPEHTLEPVHIEENSRGGHTIHYKPLIHNYPLMDHNSADPFHGKQPPNAVEESIRQVFNDNYYENLAEQLITHINYDQFNDLAAKKAEQEAAAKVKEENERNLRNRSPERLHRYQRSQHSVFQPADQAKGSHAGTAAPTSFSSFTNSNADNPAENKIEGDQRQHPHKHSRGVQSAEFRPSYPEYQYARHTLTPRRNPPVYSMEAKSPETQGNFLRNPLPRNNNLQHNSLPAPPPPPHHLRIAVPINPIAPIGNTLMNLYNRLPSVNWTPSRQVMRRPPASVWNEDDI